MTASPAGAGWLETSSARISPAAASSRRSRADRVTHDSRRGLIASSPPPRPENPLKSRRRQEPPPVCGFQNVYLAANPRGTNAVTTVKRFRFGVLAESVQSAGAFVNTARRAEDAGFATFLMRDHFVEEPFGHQFAPFTALATVASVTKRLRVGSLVFSNDYRHPLLLAKEAATLDVLSGGRLELGLGTGFESREYEQTGFSRDSPSVRAERLGEGVQIIKKAFAGEPFTFTGAYYSVTDFKSFPPSLQRPHPPLL